MDKNALDSIVACMAVSEKNNDIQAVQTAYRIKLVEFWEIKEGDHVLEIGCGQGDTTAVLAHYAGPTGHVHGIDIGSPNYGAPITLGESAAYLAKSRLGNQITMDFGVDLLAEDVDFPENSFDCIVLSHCSWYFQTAEAFSKLLKKVKGWGRKLCFAEWDTTIHFIEQYPHLLSILIQAQYEAFKKESDANVRTLLTPIDIQAVIEEHGWRIKKQESIFTPNLQDAEWEIEKVLVDIDAELKAIDNIPSKMAALIQSEVQMLKNAIIADDYKPLSTYAFIAE